MKAAEFRKAVTMDEADLLGRLVALLAEHRIRYCLVGGQAVNAYVEPLVSLDVDLVVAADQLESAEALLGRHFRLQRFAHSLNVTVPGSDLRVRIQLDPRYSDFLSRAVAGHVLGRDLPVATVEDVLSGKLWAAQDPTRRPSKRQKDLADIARILETYPHLRGSVPDAILRRLL
jgi:hypothetical protein